MVPIPFPTREVIIVARFLRSGGSAVGGDGVYEEEDSG